MEFDCLGPTTATTVLQKGFRCGGGGGVIAGIPSLNGVVQLLGVESPSLD